MPSRRRRPARCAVHGIEGTARLAYDNPTPLPTDGAEEGVGSSNFERGGGKGKGRVERSGEPDARAVDVVVCGRAPFVIVRGIHNCVYAASMRRPGLLRACAHRHDCPRVDWGAHRPSFSRAYVERPLGSSLSAPQSLVSRVGERV